MAKGIYVGAGGVARRMKKAYVGVAGKARAVRKMYVGVGNRARLCYSAEPEYAGTGVHLAAPKYGAKAAATGNYALDRGRTLRWHGLERGLQYGGRLRHIPHTDDPGGAGGQEVSAFRRAARGVCSVCGRDCYADRPRGP